MSLIAGLSNTDEFGVEVSPSYQQNVKPEKVLDERGERLANTSSMLNIMPSV